MAVSNLSRRRLRSFLTLIGIVIGIGAVVALISLGSGMQSAISQQLEQFGANKIMVMPNVAGSFGPPTGAAERLTPTDLERIRDVRGVEVAIPLLSQQLQIEYRDKKSLSYIIGIEPEESQMFFSDVQSYELEIGRYMEEGEKYTAVIGSLLKHDVFDEDIGLRDKIKIKDKDIRVIGILKPLGNPQDDSSIIMSIDTLRELVNSPEEISMIMIKASEDPKGVAALIEVELEKLHGEKVFMALTTEQIQARIQTIFGTISLVLSGIAAISLVVAGFGIMNTMYMAVLERTREIGVMKAIGASNGMVMMNFLMETAILGFVGGLVGIAVGSSMYFGLSNVSAKAFGLALPVVLSPMLMIEALVFAVFVGVVSGLFPAYRASKLQPVEALRYE